jgi:hypothetical protein
MRIKSSTCGLQAPIRQPIRRALGASLLGRFGAKTLSESCPALVAAIQSLP